MKFEIGEVEHHTINVASLVNLRFHLTGLNGYVMVALYMNSLF